MVYPKRLAGTRVMKAWLIPLAALEIADLLTSSSAGISWEGNPLVKYLWSEYGLIPLVVLKAAGVGLFYLAIWVCTHKDNPFHEGFTKAVKVSLTFRTLVALAVVAWNLSQI